MNGWPAWDAKQKWREIAFTSSKADQMQLFDIASRIASGITYCQMRLHDLVAAYAFQLRGRFARPERPDYESFRDMNSFDVYKAIHALFWEMAVLRDVLAEFVAIYCLSQASITTMASLRKALRKITLKPPIAEEILQGTEESIYGWIFTFSSYRDFFTHAAPMEQAAGIAFAVQDHLELANGRRVPQLYYPLPALIHELNQKRSKGLLYHSFKDLVEASARTHNRDCEPDALNYLSHSFDAFVQLATKLLHYSPIAAEPIILGPEDIVGSVEIT